MTFCSVESQGQKCLWDFQNRQKLQSQPESAPLWNQILPVISGCQPCLLLAMSTWMSPWQTLSIFSSSKPDLTPSFFVLTNDALSHMGSEKKRKKKLCSQYHPPREVLPFSFSFSLSPSILACLLKWHAPNATAQVLFLLANFHVAASGPKLGHSILLPDPSCYWFFLISKLKRVYRRSGHNPNPLA